MTQQAWCRSEDIPVQNLISVNLFRRAEPLTSTPGQLRQAHLCHEKEQLIQRAWRCTADRAAHPEINSVSSAGLKKQLKQLANDLSEQKRIASTMQPHVFQTTAVPESKANAHVLAGIYASVFSTPASSVASISTLSDCSCKLMQTFRPPKYPAHVAEAGEQPCRRQNGNALSTLQAAHSLKHWLEQARRCTP